MNQHGSFLCEELLHCPISILEAAPATLLLLEGTQELHPKHERERGESGGERERWKIPPVNRNETRKPCVRKETACGVGSSG